MYIGAYFSIKHSAAFQVDTEEDKQVGLMSDVQRWETHQLNATKLQFGAKDALSQVSYFIITFGFNKIY